MITAVDTSVILDVLIDDPQFGSASEAALRQGSGEGKLIVCECVIAEVFPAIRDRDRFAEFVGDWQLHFAPLDLAASTLAGEYFALYLRRGGRAKRVPPDFLIGAHAAMSADRLLARDRGYVRDYFTSLELWDPSRR